MTAAETLLGWTAHNTARRMDLQQRNLSPQSWADDGQIQLLGASADRTSVRGLDPVADEWAMLERDGFYQDEDGLRLMPVLVYPGIALDQFTTKPTTPPANSSLYVRIAYVLQGNATGGWNGALTATATLHWGRLPLPPNVIFPGSYARSMPPNNTFVWHYELGHTDESATYTPTTEGHNRALGQLIPPL